MSFIDQLFSLSETNEIFKMLFLILSVPIVLGLLFMFFFLRSSKEMPKTWKELELELKFQFHGLIGYYEDVLTSFKNKVGE